MSKVTVLYNGAILTGWVEYDNGYNVLVRIVDNNVFWFLKHNVFDYTYGVLNYEELSRLAILNRTRKNCPNHV